MTLRNKIISGVILSVAFLTGVLITVIVITRGNFPEDYGAQRRPGQNGEVELWNPSRSIIVAVDDSVDNDVLRDAVTWWHAKSPYRFNALRGHDIFDSYFSKGLDNEETVITMHVTSITEDVGDLTEIGYNRTNGAIMACFVGINSRYIGHRSTYTAIVEHSLGHCLGLEDDPNPGIDLDSIMRLGLNPGGRLTNSDAAVLRRNYDAAY